MTAQVQHEFVKHREKIINIFQLNVTELIPRSFKNEVVKKIATFKNNNKAKLEDYKEILESLDEFEKQANALFLQIEEKVDDKKGSANKLLLDDDFLELLTTTINISNLDDTTVLKIKEQYNNLIQPYKDSLKEKKTEEDTATSESYSLKIFPGCAEKSNKDDPTGDFIIFHEMMTYAKENATDVIFLTNDTTKGDWLRKDGTSHLHYLENFYQNTGQILFIIDAERLLSDLFKTSFESLIKTDENDYFKSNLLTRDQLQDYLGTSPFNEFENTAISDDLVKELFKNNIFSLDDLKPLTFNVEEISSWLKNDLKRDDVKALVL